MISVTAAAHSFNRSTRSLGTHLKAYGSGRVAIGTCHDGVDFVEKCPRKSSLTELALKLWHVFLNLLRTFCPFLGCWFSVKSIVITQKDADVENSAFDLLEEKLVLKILQMVDGASIVRLSSTSKKLRQFVREHSEQLPKVQKDQVKLYFDEGEVIVSPMDERKVPSRHQMVPIELLPNYLRHVSTLSLFIRGLIPAETLPIFKRLAHFNFGCSQIYLLWCDFNMETFDYLRQLFCTNSLTLSDIGLESCTPSRLISDSLISQNLAKLVSLRVWQDSAVQGHLITDQTLFTLADLTTKGQSQLETLDLNFCQVTVFGMAALVEAWFRQPAQPVHLCISLHNSLFHRSDLIEQCRNVGIPLSASGVLQRDSAHLTVHVN